MITEGLTKDLGFELGIITNKRSEVEYLMVFEYLIDYILDYKPIIKVDQTIAYHSWALKFNKLSNSLCELYEAEQNGDGFIQGVDYSIKVISDQYEQCRIHEAYPLYPTFNQKVVISKGVYEGLGVDAVRYPSLNHMSGWWITTELYDDNIDSLMTVHYFHLAFKRPDLLKYLALPFGYRFYKTEQADEIWFDKNTLE